MITSSFKTIVGAAFSASVAMVCAFSAVTALAQGLPGELDAANSGWDGLLRKHVSWNSAGTTTSVNYKAFAQDRNALKQVIDQYGGLTKAQFDSLKREDRMAYLINVYNANTVELILRSYPDIKSIKDIGGVFGKPWKIQFIRLFGTQQHLDHVEHELLRAPGVYDEPRIHFVVNCASIGCPALRPEAITGAKLEAQLEDSTKRFMRDKTRNRFNAKTGNLEVSKIFDWFKVDWLSGYKGISTREQFFGRYAELLAEDAAGQQTVRDGKASLSFLNYDWGLNDRR